MTAALSLVVEPETKRRHIARIERAYVGAIIRNRALHSVHVGVLDIEDPHARESYGAFANVKELCKCVAGCECVTMASVLAEIRRDREFKQDRRCDARELLWFDEEIAIVPEKPAELVRGWEREIKRLAAERAEDEERFAEQEREQQEIDRAYFEDLDPGGASAFVEPPPPKPRARWHRCPDLVDIILARADEQWIALKLGADEIVRVRPGGIVVLMGPTGAGKTSLAICMIIAHLAAGGVVIVLSRELPGDELVARLIGAQCDESWPGLLTGRVPRADMLRVTSERMLVLDREHATLEELDAATKSARTEYPDAPVLVAIDYLQILESTERDARAKVSDIVSRIDNIARAHRAVVLALSQMSRASSRAASKGEVLGADSTDGGAESAAIERAATITLSIGAAGEERDDGTRAVELSLGKARMTGGDSVHTASWCGRSGRWRLSGEARPAAEVRAERATERDSAVLAAAERAIVAGAAAAEPVTREQLCKMAVAAMGRCSRVVQRQAITRALASGALVEVQRRPRKARAWLIWTPERAAAAGIPLVGGAS